VIDPPKFDFVLQIRRHFDEATNLMNETDDEVQRDEQEVEDNETDDECNTDESDPEDESLGIFQGLLIANSGEI
jgi:hypothetical protein